MIAPAAAPRFRFIDLFAGVGGFHHALTGDLGGQCVWAVEIDDLARRVYRAAFPDTPLHADIRTVTRSPAGADRSPAAVRRVVPEHDVLCAGFPCQPFSKSGAQRGFRDATRGTLFFDILQIVRARRPRFLILENVRNLAGPRQAETWRTVIESLRAEGYSVGAEPLVFSPHLLPPELGGRPQVRDRVFILAELDGGLPDAPIVPYAPVARWDPRTWRISDWLDDDGSVSDIQRYQLRPIERAWLDAWQVFVEDVESETLPGFPLWADEFVAAPIRAVSPEPAWKARFKEKNRSFYREHRDFLDAWLARSWLRGTKYTVRDFPPTRRKFEWQARGAQPRRRDRDLWRLVIHMRPSGIRVKPATYLPALVAITQTSVIGERGRRITPREAARLQGMPWEPFERAAVDDASAYRQLGNAVNVGAVQHVAQALFGFSGTGWCTGRAAPRHARAVQLALPL